VHARQLSILPAPLLTQSHRMNSDKFVCKVVQKNTRRILPRPDIGCARSHPLGAGVVRVGVEDGPLVELLKRDAVPVSVHADAQTCKEIGILLGDPLRQNRCTAA